MYFILLFREKQAKSVFYVPSVGAVVDPHESCSVAEEQAVDKLRRIVTRERITQMRDVAYAADPCRC